LDPIAWVVAFQDCDFKHVSRNCVNQHELSTWAINCDEERVDFAAAWNCPAAPERQFTMVRKPVDAVELLVAIENCPIQPVLSQAASIEHSVI
jgi:hypothetical protein